MKKIFTKLLYEMEKQHDTVLATIIRESGSTPRGVGAQMLVYDTGIVGTIGGGNVENLSILHARELIAEKHGDIREYKLRHSHTEDIGMVCGGDVTVLFCYISGTDETWKALASAVLKRIEERKAGFFRLPMNGLTACLCESNSEDGALSLPLPIGERAILFGAGHCSLALAPILHSVGFRITVFDERSELLTKERFPTADCLICGDFTKISNSLSISQEDYVVVMTSGHSYDFQVQEQLLRSEFAYFGVIGSRAKIASVNRRLQQAGISDDAIARVHSPIGLPIKAVTPEEIAVSITAEMILTRASNRDPSQLLHSCPMH